MSEHQNDDRFVRMREQAEELIRQGQANFAPESYPFRGYRMLSYNPSLLAQLNAVLRHWLSASI